MKTRIAAATNRSVMGRYAFACAAVRGGLFVSHQTRAVQPCLEGLERDDKVQPGGGSA